MILLISDLHKSLDSMEEVNSVKWLLNVLDELKPDYLIGAGDWGQWLRMIFPKSSRGLG